MTLDLALAFDPSRALDDTVADMTAARSPRPGLRVVSGDEDVVADDRDLVAGALGGDRKSEAEIYRRHVRYVSTVVTRLLGYYGDVEDTVQDTFVIALSNLPSLRNPDALRPWLAQIAVSQVRRRFRRRRLMRMVGLDQSVDDATLETLAREDASAETRASLAELDRALAKLPADQRIAWMLRRVEGFALDEVARACTCSLATAKRRIAAADVRVAAFVALSGIEP